VQQKTEETSYGIKIWAHEKERKKEMFFFFESSFGQQQRAGTAAERSSKKKIFSISLSLSRIRSFPFLYYPLEKIGAPLSFCIHIIHTYADYK